MIRGVYRGLYGIRIKGLLGRLLYSSKVTGNLPLKRTVVYKGPSVRLQLVWQSVMIEGQPIEGGAAQQKRRALDNIMIGMEGSHSR